MSCLYREPSIVIIGAGMTGIVLCHKLKKAGYKNITVFEKKGKVGGTWRENTYPGVACDVPAHMYSYSFEQNTEWKHRFARGEELLNYFQDVSDKYEVTNHIQFNETVTEAIYRNNKWHLKSDKGSNLVVDFIFSATGILHHPAFPNIPGLDSFNGTCFHTAEWDHEVNFKGKKVGIIGTGSTAAQVIPSLINKGINLNIFQRTPQWILPLPDYTAGKTLKRIIRLLPWTTKIYRKIYELGAQHIITKAVTGYKPQLTFMSWLVKRHLKTVKDSELRKKLTPDYQIGCKRIVISNRFYKAIQKDNAQLITDGIEQIESNGIRTVDGKLHELDSIILSTGFDPFKFVRPMNLIGKNGLHIEEAWKNEIKAYRSVHLPNFPNFFLMLGPNTPIGNYSVTMMSETQADYIIQLIKHWQQGSIETIEATQQAVDKYNSFIKSGLGKTVWAAGCQSWYLDSKGDPILWPYSWKSWVKMMSTPIYSDFHTNT